MDHQCKNSMFRREVSDTLKFLSWSLTASAYGCHQLIISLLTLSPIVLLKPFVPINVYNLVLPVCTHGLRNITVWQCSNGSGGRDKDMFESISHGEIQRARQWRNVVRFSRMYALWDK